MSGLLVLRYRLFLYGSSTTGVVMKRILEKLDRFRRHKHSSFCIDEKKYATMAGKKHECICKDIRIMQEESQIDELVWKMVGAAHEIVDIEPLLLKYYPEMAPFIRFIVMRYPALKEKK